MAIKKNEIDYFSGVNIPRELITSEIAKARKMVCRDLLEVGQKPTAVNSVLMLAIIGAGKVLDDPSGIRKFIKELIGEAGK